MRTVPTQLTIQRAVEILNREPRLRARHPARRRASRETMLAVVATALASRERDRRPQRARTLASAGLKKPRCAGLPTVRPGGLEPPRTSQSTRPST
jgi:hypothetical protein